MKRLSLALTLLLSSFGIDGWAQVGELSGQQGSQISASQVQLSPIMNQQAPAAFASTGLSQTPSVNPSAFLYKRSRAAGSAYLVSPIFHSSTLPKSSSHAVQVATPSKVGAGQVVASVSDSQAGSVIGYRASGSKGAGLEGVRWLATTLSNPASLFNQQMVVQALAAPIETLSDIGGKAFEQTGSHNAAPINAAVSPRGRGLREEEHVRLEAQGENANAWHVPQQASRSNGPGSGSGSSGGGSGFGSGGSGNGQNNNAPKKPGTKADFKTHWKAYALALVVAAPLWIFVGLRSWPLGIALTVGVVTALNTYLDATRDLPSFSQKTLAMDENTPIPAGSDFRVTPDKELKIDRHFGDDWTDSHRSNLMTSEGSGDSGEGWLSRVLGSFSVEEEASGRWTSSYSLFQDAKDKDAENSFAGFSGRWSSFKALFARSPRGNGQFLQSLSINGNSTHNLNSSASKAALSLGAPIFAVGAGILLSIALGNYYFLSLSVGGLALLLTGIITKGVKLTPAEAKNALPSDNFLITGILSQAGTPESIDAGAVNPSKSLVDQVTPRRQVFSPRVKRTIARATVFAMLLAVAPVSKVIYDRFFKSRVTISQPAFERTTLIVPSDLAAAVGDAGMPIGSPKNSGGGGGGGGDRSKLPAPRGRLPKQALQQLSKPMVVVKNQHPKLPVEPTIVAPEIHDAATDNLPNLGDPSSKIPVLASQSNGTGSGGGIGSGQGGGVGSGNGIGNGPGDQFGRGGGRPGKGNGGLAALSWRGPHPRYPDEAKRNRVNAKVTLELYINGKGQLIDPATNAVVDMKNKSAFLAAVKVVKTMSPNPDPYGFIQSTLEAYYQGFLQCYQTGQSCFDMPSAWRNAGRIHDKTETVEIGINVN